MGNCERQENTWSLFFVDLKRKEPQLPHMPKTKEGKEPKSKKGKKRVSIKTRLVREHRVKIKQLRKDLRELERDLRSLTGRRRKQNE